MRKILALILTLSMLATNVIPIYANTSDIAAKKALFDAAQETFEQINNEYYGEGVLEEYENTMTKLLTNLSSTSTFNFGTTMTYYFDGEASSSDVVFSYNDDGSSIVINFAVSTSYGNVVYTTVGSFYVDDTKIVINIPDISSEPIVYNFGDSLEGTDFEDVDMNNFKYSNIKKYINLVLELETSGKLDAIIDDYQANFLEYVAKADFTYNDNTVTMTISGDLVNEYLNQLATKLRNDKNIKEIYDSFGFNYSFDLVMAEIETGIKDFATELGNSFSISYYGLITDGVLSSNKFVFYYDNVPVGNFKVDFKDLENGILSDVEMIFSDEYSDANLNFSLTGDEEKTLVVSTTVNGELLSEGTMKYTYDGLNTTSTGEFISYSTPYFYITEEPKLEVMSFDEWFNGESGYYDDSIALSTANLDYAKNQIANIENSTSDTVYLDIDDDAYVYLIDYTYYYYYGEYVLEEVLNVDTGEVLNKDGALYVLNSWIDDLNTDLAYMASSKEELTSNSEASYQEYVDLNKEFYEYELVEYSAYLEYIENGSPVDVLRQIISVDTTVTEEEFSAIQNQEVYTNDELTLESNIVYSLTTSTVKNSANVDGAISLKDYILNN